MRFSRPGTPFNLAFEVAFSILLIYFLGIETFFQIGGPMHKLYFMALCALLFGSFAHANSLTCEVTLYGPGNKTVGSMTFDLASSTDLQQKVVKSVIPGIDAKCAYEKVDARLWCGFYKGTQALSSGSLFPVNSQSNLVIYGDAPGYQGMLIACDAL